MPDEIQQEINDVSNSDSIYLIRESCWSMQQQQQLQQ